MKKLFYECIFCGYIYDPAEGEEDMEIPPGVPIEELDDEEFFCPECYANKKWFEPVWEDDEE